MSLCTKHYDYTVNSLLQLCHDQFIDHVCGDKVSISVYGFCPFTQSCNFLKIFLYFRGFCFCFNIYIYIYNNFNDR